MSFWTVILVKSKSSWSSICACIYIQIVSIQYLVIWHSYLPNYKLPIIMPTQHQFLPIKLSSLSPKDISKIFPRYLQDNSKQPPWSVSMHSPPQTRSSPVFCMIRFSNMSSQYFGSDLETCLLSIFWWKHLINLSELISHILMIPSLEPDTAVLSSRSCKRSWGKHILTMFSSFKKRQKFLQC